MIKPEYKHSEITEQIIGCAMRVHSKLRNGFPEIIYQRAFQIELLKTALQVEREISQDVYYEDHLVGIRKVDFLINKTILVEIKAASCFDPAHFNQIINYLESFRLEIGLLINFGKDKLEFKRFTNNNTADENDKNDYNEEMILQAFPKVIITIM